MQFTLRRVTVNYGPWAEIKDPVARERQLHIRPVIVQQLVRHEDGTTETIVYTKFRAADLRVGNTVQTVVWDEVLRATDGTVLGYKPWVLFDGYQRGVSPFAPYVTDPDGADSSFVAFNSATRTPETQANNLQIKLGFSHNITSKLLYSIKLSRLDLRTQTSVLDENGNLKDPAEYTSAGLPVVLPSQLYDPDLPPARITVPVWYTDDGSPYFVTAYDYPFYSDQRSLQYLIRGDIISEQIKGHRIKSGLQLIYNDLRDDERVQPAEQRTNDDGSVQQGLNVNIYENFNSEGAVYAQDKWEYEGMVVNAGLRYEWFFVGNNDQILISNSEIDPSVDSFKWNLSPRLGMAFPITDRDKFFFHYGRFTQWPSTIARLVSATSK